MYVVDTQKRLDREISWMDFSKHVFIFKTGNDEHNFMVQTVVDILYPLKILTFPNDWNFWLSSFFTLALWLFLYFLGIPRCSVCTLEGACCE